MSNSSFSTAKTALSNNAQSGSAQSGSLSSINELIYATAKQREGDCLALLELLRQLNELHYDIRETLFRDALPDNRQKLYSLLKDIEQEGGWPYIPRMKLLALLENMELENMELENTEIEADDATPVAEAETEQP